MIQLSGLVRWFYSFLLEAAEMWTLHVLMICGFLGHGSHFTSSSSNQIHWCDLLSRVHEHRLSLDDCLRKLNLGPDLPADYNHVLSTAPFPTRYWSSSEGLTHYLQSQILFVSFDTLLLASLELFSFSQARFCLSAAAVCWSSIVWELLCCSRFKYPPHLSPGKKLLALCAGAAGGGGNLCRCTFRLQGADDGRGSDGGQGGTGSLIPGESSRVCQLKTLRVESSSWWILVYLSNLRLVHKQHILS